MNLEQFVYGLPSTQAFLDAIADNSGNKVTMVLLPDNISRAMVGRLIRNRFSRQSSTLNEIIDQSEPDPVLASAGAMKVQWPSDRTLRSLSNLLRCENLPDLLYVQRIPITSTDSMRRWRDFIEGWANECHALRGQGAGKLPSLCVVAKLRDFEFALPKADEGIKFQWWWGFPSGLEMRLACRIACEQIDESVEAGRWRERVLPSLVGSDVQLAENMWDLVTEDQETIVGGLADYWQSIQDPNNLCPIDELIDLVGRENHLYLIGQEVPEKLRQAWASGSLVYTPECGLEIHPSLLACANRKTDVLMRLWRGQAEYLLPMLNEIRLKVCIGLTQAFGDDWPVRWAQPASAHELEQVKLSALAAELGYIDYLFSSFREQHQLGAYLNWAGLVMRAKNLRNQIAHYKPVLYQQYLNLCDERVKVGI